MKTLSNKVIIPPTSTLLSCKEIILEIKRVTKVVKGGKKLSFRSIVLIGNKKGLIGLGVGKSLDLSKSLEKAIINAKENIQFIETTIINNLKEPLTFTYKHKNTFISFYKTSKNKGIKACSILKSILELSGINNITVKQRGSKSSWNIARSSLLALQYLIQKIN